MDCDIQPAGPHPFIPLVSLHPFILLAFLPSLPVPVPSLVRCVASLNPSAQNGMDAFSLFSQLSTSLCFPNRNSAILLFMKRLSFTALTKSFMELKCILTM